MSVANKVGEIRKSLGLSEKQLSALAHMSVRELRWIEAGMLTRFDQAVVVSQALDRPLERLFPKARSLFKKMRDGDLGRLLNDDKLLWRFEKAGIDPDPHVHTFRFILNNGLQRDVEVSSRECLRIRRNLQAPRSIFFSFDTITENIAINVTQIAFWHFLFDLPFRSEEAEANRPIKKSLSIWFRNAQEPWLLDVQPDPVEFGPEEADDEAIIQALFFDIDHCIDGSDVYHLDDEDGETAFFRADNVSMLSVPIQMTEPALWRRLIRDDDA